MQVTTSRQLTSSFSVIAVHVVGIVAGAEEAECSTSVVHEAVGAGLDEALVSEALVVKVTLTLVRHILGSRSAAVRTTGALAALLGSSEIIFEIVRVGISLGDNGRSATGRL